MTVYSQHSIYQELPESDKGTICDIESNHTHMWICYADKLLLEGGENQFNIYIKY